MPCLGGLYVRQYYHYVTGQPQESQVCQPLLVATCHVHWDPEYCDVKLIQTMILMSELKNIIEESQRSFRPGSTAPACNNIPLILCGDFNSLPDSGGCPLGIIFPMTGSYPVVWQWSFFFKLYKCEINIGNITLTMHSNVVK